METIVVFSKKTHNKIWTTATTSIWQKAFRVSQLKLPKFNCTDLKSFLITQALLTKLKTPDLD